MIFLLLKNFSYSRLLTVLTSVIILQGVYIFQQAKVGEELIVFHSSRQTVIGKKAGGELLVYHKAVSPVKESRLITNYKVGEDISEIKQKPLQNIYHQKGYFLILLDSTGIFPKQFPPKGLILLSNSPKVNLERVLGQTDPAVIIADGSNYRTLVVKWRETAGDYGIPFHYTAEDGAYTLK